MATVYRRPMQATPKGDHVEVQGEAKVRLRVEVYDALAKRRGAVKVAAQARLHGIGRQHMFHLRSGRKQASLPLAMRMAADLGTAVEALFARDGK